MKANQNKNQENGNQKSENAGQRSEARDQKGGVGQESPEQWWARLKPAERMLAQLVAGMMEEVTDSKRVEIRRERECIRARFIYLLKQPEKGCLSAILLPESPRRGWN